MKKFFTRRIKRGAKSRQSRRGFKFACLALGLVTAWGDEATADATLKLEVSPQQTLTNAFVLYGNNVSTGVIRSLGTIPGGQTTTFDHTFIDECFPTATGYVTPPRTGPGRKSQPCAMR